MSKLDARPWRFAQLPGHRLAAGRIGQVGRAVEIQDRRAAEPVSALLRLLASDRRPD